MYFLDRYLEKLEYLKIKTYINIINLAEFGDYKKVLVLLRLLMVILFSIEKDLYLIIFVKKLISCKIIFLINYL